MSDRNFFSSNRIDSEGSSGLPDAPNPLSSTGNYKNAAGDFDLHRKLDRKKKSLKDLDQPHSESDNATDRYFGSFSIEAKRNVMDLLKTHPMFDSDGKVRKNRVQNNTREVMPNDPTKTVQTGGNISYENQPQASQRKY